MSIKGQTIGFIGLGAMGRGMAANCVKKGFTLVVCDLSPEPVDYLVSLGARAVATPAEVAGQCGVIVTCLPNGQVVREVVMGADGVLAHAEAGRL
ncbi:MAG: NAD(P)-binding domain-containing protein, partial [Pseudomonadota bacterium]